jgi:hypothetical protein
MVGPRMKPNGGFLVIWTEQQVDGAENEIKLEFFPTRDDAERFVRERLSEEEFRPTTYVYSRPGVFVVEANFYGRDGSA